jgi:hypothetical protein
LGLSRGGTRPKGYFLGLDDIGRPILRILIDDKWEKLVAAEPIKLYRWTHIAGTFDGRKGKMVIYIDGKESSSLDNVEGYIGKRQNGDLY